MGIVGGRCRDLEARVWGGLEMSTDGSGQGRTFRWAWSDARRAEAFHCVISYDGDGRGRLSRTRTLKRKLMKMLWVSGAMHLIFLVSH